MSLERIRALPCWQGEIEALPLKGGLSNESWKVTDGRGAHVVRFGVDFPFHHVFRDRELAAARAAHAAGFAPEVEWAGEGAMVSAFLDARTWTETDMRANPDRIGRLLADFHGRMLTHLEGPGAVFWVFHVIRDYGRTLAAHRSRFAAELPRLLAVNAALEAAQIPLPIIVGHHDLLPGNFLEADGRLWLIDFEYAGFGTAMFDLASAAGNGGMALVQEGTMIEAYLGAAPDAAFLKSFAAMKCAALMREAMWAMVSEIFLAAPGADYDTHARDYLGRFETALGDYRQRHGALD
ncbi:phosphotransferase [Frigidibacter sp. RF13]|uniref:phosphotransferase n=1 Tax=Frigidibacter sp. RF13 TaxID=2997340 RepID=UPI002270A8CA|nr:phosphotransferase [Frigidibacter sp. RF13]MCY1127277.1 phosphotransferase [Frigidibacter sp. RF13]